MKIYKTTVFLIVALTLCQPLFSQNNDKQDFKIGGKRPDIINVNQTITSNSEVSPFGNKITSIYGLALTADVTFSSDKGLVRVILLDQNYSEYLVYETYSLLDGNSTVSIDALCEETALLEGVTPRLLRFEVVDAKVDFRKLTVTNEPETGKDIAAARKLKKAAQDNYKIQKLNKSLAGRGLMWVAGVTDVSELTYSERKKLYGQGTFPPGFEYYSGGIISSGPQLKSTSGSLMIDKWDWRMRHGVNWITSIKNQGSCGSCWAFAATGATEAQVNLFFNQSINMDLSEQDLISCSGAGDCAGGYPSYALNYIASNGMVDEAAFRYTTTNNVCSNKSSNPTQLIKIAGKLDFGSTAYPYSSDVLKQMIIKYGPVSGGLYDWSHAMTLVGWQVVQEGDRFYYRDLTKATYWITVPAGSALIGKTVWIFKNSWGTWGDGGYVYVETAVSNIGWTHALLTPVQSLKQSFTVTCVDRDGDGFYWWGLGARPASCPNQLAEDGDDSNKTLGPLDEYGYCAINGISATPVANFSSDKISVTVGGSITYSDLSTNTPTSWSWTFQGGTPATSTLKNPVVTYSTAGTYNVSLTVSNSSGSNTKDQAGYVTVNAVTVQAPVANFSSDKTSVTAGGAVVFSDLSTNSPTSWSWSFPGGTPSTSTAKNPVITYNTAGTYNVSLTATNSAGSNTKNLTGYINVTAVVVPAPVANFTSDKTAITEGGTVTYTDLSTNTPTAWYWSFPGGTPSTSTAKNPVVTYNTAGTYNVSLTATNASGSNTKDLTGYMTVTTVVVPAPVANFTADLTSVAEGGFVMFTDLSTNATAWTWSFPGGTPAVSTEKNPIVYYYTAGTYNVSLTVSNSAGQTNKKDQTGYITVTAVVVPPSVADFTADQTTVYPSSDVIYTDLSTNNPTSWLWVFDGGTPSTSTAKNPKVTYNTPGSYNVSLTVSNSGGSPSTKLKGSYISVMSNVVNYCSSNGTASREWISSVKVGTASKASGSSGAAGYEDFTAFKFTATAGVSYPVVLTTSYSTKTVNAETWSVWIDFNHDSDFTDAGEQVISATRVKNSLNSSILIPKSALAGETRMRVSMKRNSLAIPCEIFTNGEVEDYTINISGPGSTGSKSGITSEGAENMPMLKVYPNPATRDLNIQIGEVSEQARMEVYSMQGQLMVMQNITETVTRIDLGSWPAGVYMVMVYNGNSLLREKVIKE